MKKDLNHREGNDKGDNSIDPAVENAWMDEVERRAEEVDSGKVKMIPGEQVMENLRDITNK